MHRLTCALLALPLLLAACGPSEELRRRDVRIQDLEAELSEARADEEQLGQRLATLQERNEALSRLVFGLAGDVDRLQVDHAEVERRFRAARESIEQLGRERGRLSADLERSRQRLSSARRTLTDLRNRERRARERIETFRDLVRRFQAMIEAGEVRVHVVNNRMVVELPEAVLFDSGRANIKADGRRVLTEVAEILDDVEGRDFQIAGHTDDVPIRTARFPSNWELSTTRALTVTHFLVERGVEEERLSAAGFADTEPVAENDSEQGRQQNRRIEIVLLPNYDELPDLSELEEAVER